MTLAERQKGYEKVSDYHLTPRLPILLRINGKNFAKLTEHLPHPSPELAKIFAESMLYCVSKIQGCVFGLSVGDEVTFVLNNFQTENTEPWFENRLQKIVSVGVSSFTSAFCKLERTLDIDLKLSDDPVFDARAFVVPSITEAVNNLIFRQSILYRKSLEYAAFKELSLKFSTEKAEDLLENTNSNDQKNLLTKYLGIEFEDYYPAYYYKGIGLYRVPSLISTNEDQGSLIRSKWELDWELPLFVSSQDFLHQIILTGKDVIRG